MTTNQGMLRATEHNSTIFLYPEEESADFQGPPQTLPRSGSHEREWIAACKGGPNAMSNFDYAGPLVEFLMLGNVATRVPGALQYDPLAGRIVNNADADALLQRQYRKGWSLQGSSILLMPRGADVSVGSPHSSNVLFRFCDRAHRNPHH
jgi:hypothetical protein